MAIWASCLLVSSTLFAGEETPALPFGQPKPREARWGSILLLGGPEKEETLTGKISFTQGKALQIHDVEKKNVVEVKPSDVAAIDAVIEKESIEDEWTWKEMGNDEKIKTGRTYPDRMYLFTVTLKDAPPASPDAVQSPKKIQGHIVGAPLYVTPADGRTRRVILRTHQRGDFGSKLEDLIYVAKVAFHDEGSPPPWPLKKDAPQDVKKDAAGVGTGKPREQSGEEKPPEQAGRTGEVR